MRIPPSAIARLHLPFRASECPYGSRGVGDRACMAVSRCLSSLSCPCQQCDQTSFVARTQGCSGNKPSQAQCSTQYGQPVEVMVRLAVHPGVGVNVSSGGQFFYAVILWSGGCVESQKLLWKTVCSRCAVDSRSSRMPWNVLLKYSVQHDTLSQFKMCWDAVKAPFNQWVGGSCPSRATTCRTRL